ncbi:SH3 beta-barrel fold-containing protein [Spirosoma sp.]|uniref:SH3 beta-barrel fold-containing protein n=1 Tax=Spirosoma sp. TaxID=1899569 RepID=UPI00260248D6|nr:SH3 beta-barrel fold-containing protein [Spirosoma sp.]MCX6218368.1 SH3 beta-barrel fold-containing protein [Spirosoma sp.]
MKTAIGNPTITRNDRPSVLRLTWQLIRKSGLAFGEALKKAYAAIRAKLILSQTDERGVWIQFKKVDGTIRSVLATRNTAHIPTDKQPKQAGTPETNTIKYFDIWANQWKSFQADALISIG